MSITPAELPGLLRALKARVEASAIPVVNAIAESYEDHLKNVTLTESGSHEPVTRTPAPAGRPPALMPGGLHGSLRDSVARTPGVGGGGVATATVSPHVIYAGTQEFGGVHTGDMWLWVGYVGPHEVVRRNWRKRTVTIPPRPFMSTAVAESIADGQLVRAAEETFMAVVWGV